MELVITESPKSVCVITPSVGSDKLKDAIDSVQEQTYKNVKHLVVLDGPGTSLPAVSKERPLKLNKNTQFVITPEKTGADGYNGQRIYAAYPHLVNADYILFLDEDNWYDPDHVESMIDTIRSKNYDFAYSLRKIYSEDMQYLVDDNCESLGHWPIYFTHDNPQYLIDTSAYAFTRQFIQRTCHLWHTGPWGEDRRYLHAVRNHAKWGTSGIYSLCYRLGGNPNSVNKEFFDKGNQVHSQIYEGKFPWKRT